MRPVLVFRDFVCNTERHINMQVTGPEHVQTRLPLVQRLVELGWDSDQIQFSPEFLVPKTPSEASKREAGRSYQGFPIDIAVFDDPKHRGDWEHLSIVFETKKPNK
jgi:type I restriction enzyme M protein